ncbi:hypothetical protein QN277_029158 [Acacia crassicarpa]|uniref:Uncharacterized protein n=1 Tax=Acacia crassicarpa TaxID=499986 RepID=A0AAE1J4Q6_9FABA|nr:hypothetical protein QN277_029158 [Acacia crassicarpa]
MDLEKRKRDGDDDSEQMITNKKKTTEPEEEDEEEVEEFFAILRRIRVAVKYFERAHGSGRSLTAKPWEPSFQADDFQGDDGNHKDGVKDLTDDSNSSLDLNSDPVPSRCNNATSLS